MAMADPIRRAARWRAPIRDGQVHTVTRVRRPAHTRRAVRRDPIYGQQLHLSGVVSHSRTSKLCLFIASDGHMWHDWWPYCMTLLAEPEAGFAATASLCALDHRSHGFHQSS